MTNEELLGGIIKAVSDAKVEMIAEIEKRFNRVDRRLNELDDRAGDLANEVRKLNVRVSEMALAS